MPADWSESAPATLGYADIELLLALNEPAAAERTASASLIGPTCFSLVPVADSYLLTGIIQPVQDDVSGNWGTQMEGKPIEKGDEVGPPRGEGGGGGGFMTV